MSFIDIELKSGVVPTLTCSYHTTDLVSVSATNQNVATQERKTFFQNNIEGEGCHLEIGYKRKLLAKRKSFTLKLKTCLHAELVVKTQQCNKSNCVALRVTVDWINVFNLNNMNLPGRCVGTMSAEVCVCESPIAGCCLGMASRCRLNITLQRSIFTLTQWRSEWPDIFMCPSVIMCWRKEEQSTNTFFFFHLQQLLLREFLCFLQRFIVAVFLFHTTDHVHLIWAAEPLRTDALLSGY